MSYGSNESLLAAVQDPLWGTPGFDGCNFCRRGRTSCRMISGRHYECLSCRAFLRKHFPQCASGPAKTKYQRQVASDDEKYEEHVAGVIEEEEAKQSGAKGRSRPTRKRKAPGGDEIEDEVPLQKLMKVSGRALEVRECLGVLWPVEAFKRDVGREVRQHEVVTLDVNGFPHTGVMRPRKFGVPDGGKEIFSTDSATTSTSALLHRSDEAAAEGETEAITKFAMGKMKVQTTAVEDKDNERDVVLKMRGADGSAKSQKKSSLDALDSIWDGPSISYGKKEKGSRDKQENGEDDGNDAQAKLAGDARASKAGSRGLLATPPAKRKSQGGSSSSQVLSTTPPGKRAKEIAASEAVLLQCQQALRAGLSPDTMRSMSDTHIKTLVARGNARMSASLVKMYAENGDESAEMTMLMSLQKVVKKLEKLSIVAPLVCVGKGKTPASGRQLLEARLDYNDHISSTFDDEQDRQSCDLGIGYLELAIERDLDTYFAAKNWAEWTKLLETSWSGLEETPAELRPHLGLLPASSRAHFKDSMLVKAICNLIRVDKSMPDVQAFAQQIKAMPTLRMDGSDQAWLEEFDSLLLVLNPMDSASVAMQVSAAKEKLATNKQLRLWRPLALHSTGTDIMKAAANALQQRAQDERYILQVTQITAAVASFSDLSKAALVNKTGAIAMPERPARKNTREVFAMILEKSSKEFQNSHAERLQVVRSALDAMTVELVRQIDHWTDTEFAKVLQDAASLATTAKGTLPKADVDKTVEAISELMRKMPKATDVSPFVSPDELRSYAKSWDARTNALRTVMSALSALSAKAVKIDDPTSIALHELLEHPDEWISKVPGFEKFKEPFVDFLFEHVGNHLRKNAPIDKMVEFWQAIEKTMTPERRGKSDFLDNLNLDDLNLEHISAQKVVLATMATGDNYAAWHNKNISMACELGILCGIPIIAGMLANSAKLAKAIEKGDLKCSTIFPKGEYDGDLIKALTTMRNELAHGKPRKVEERSPLFADVRSSIEAAYTKALNVIARAIVDDLQATEKSLDDLRDGEVLKQFVTDTESLWPEASMPKLIAATNTDEAQTIYIITKHLELHAEAVQIFVKVYASKLEEETAKVLVSFEFKPEVPRKISGLLTAVQALGRALKAGETRQNLLSKCKAALQHKDMWKLMPCHVQQMITAGESRQSQEGGKTADEQSK